MLWGSKYQKNKKTFWIALIPEKYINNNNLMTIVKKEVNIIKLIVNDQQ